MVARLRPRSRSRRRNKLHSVARTAARRGGLGNSERVCLGRVSVSSIERGNMLYKLYTETYFPVVARLRPRSRSRRRSTLHSVARTTARRGGLGNSERVCLGRVSVSSRERKHVRSYTRRHIFRWSLVCGRGHVHDGGVHYTQSRAPLRGEVDSEILNECVSGASRSRRERGNML